MKYRNILSISCVVFVLLLGELRVFSADPVLNFSKEELPESTSGRVENAAGDSPAWRPLHTENGGRVLRQERDKTQGAFQNDKNSEYLQLSLPAGSCVLLGHTVDFPLVIEDLSPSLFVKSNRGGVVLGAQVVLPNTIHPSTGKPITFLVVGNRYSGSGEWEKLEFRGRNGAPTLLSQIEHTARLLRAEWIRDGLLENVDLRDKYIRQIVLFVEGELHGTTQSELRIDALHTAGHVAARKETLDRVERNAKGETTMYFDPMNYVGFKLLASSHCVFSQPYTASTSVGSTEWKSSLEKSAPLTASSFHPGIPASSSGDRETLPQKSLYSGDAIERKYSLANRFLPDDSYSPASSMTIQLSDRILHIDGIPRGIRAVEYQGEPLAFLRQLDRKSVV